MSGMRLSDLDFLRLLPAFMRDDDAVIALSKAVNKLIGEPGKRLDTIRTWDKVDELNEAECDELAWELDIDWYDSVGMSLSVKRETIKAAQQIKRKRGTKWAVERLIETYLGEGLLAEWYEIGGEPYTFKILTTSTAISPESYAKFVEAANAAKNERSHMTGIYYYWPQAEDTAIEYGYGAFAHVYDHVKCGTRYHPVTIGFVVRSGVGIAPDGTDHLYGFPECGINGYKATVGASVVGTAIVGKSRVTN